ncbi:MAG: hypothetical protein FWH18_02845 [Marinilabiliaceae bacterium]|nr:hypothetical protein [Marinilabiliaceae bacterium]
MKLIFKSVVLACFLTGLILITSCNNGGGGGGGGPQGLIDGKISGNVGNKYNDFVDEVRAIISYHDGDFIAGDGDFKNGGFTVDLNKTIKDQYLYPIDEFDIFYDDGRWDEYSIEPSSAKMNFMDLRAYKDNEDVGLFLYSASSSTSKADAIHVYVNVVVVIKMSYSDNDESYEIDLTLEEGWNEIYSATLEKNGVETTSLSNKKPAGLTWSLEYTGDGDPDAPTTGSANGITKITATNVEGGNSYIKEVKGVLSDDLVSYQDVVTSTNYVNNGFTLELPPIESYKLISMDDFFKDLWDGGNFKVSDNSAKIRGLGIVAYNSNGGIEGIFLQEKETSSNTGFTYVFAVHVYVDKSVTVTGSYSETYGGDKFSGTMNLPHAKGWNVWYNTISFSQASNGNVTITQTLTTTNPGGLKWYFEDDLYKSPLKSTEKFELIEKLKSYSPLFTRLQNLKEKE